MVRMKTSRDPLPAHMKDLCLIWFWIKIWHFSYFENVHSQRLFHFMATVHYAQLNYACRSQPWKMNIFITHLKIHQFKEITFCLIILKLWKVYWSEKRTKEAFSPVCRRYMYLNGLDFQASLLPSTLNVTKNDGESKDEFCQLQLG